MFSSISSSVKITLAYLFFGILWISISDTIVNALSENIEALKSIQYLKGWFYIFLSSVILFFVSKKVLKDLERTSTQAEETKKLLENIINNAPVRIFWKNRNGQFLGANKLFFQDMNVNSMEQLLGETDKSLELKEHQDYVDDDQFVMKNNTKKLNYIETLTDKNGNRKILNTSKVPLLNKSNEVIGVIGVYQDITQQVEIQNKIKEQEAMILQQSKFTSMGEMIANIAHQWRQPLSIISSSTSGIKLKKEMGMSTPEFEIQALDSISENVQYLAKTIDDFSNFFKDKKIQNNVELKTILNKALSLLSSRLYDQNIEIIIEHGDISFETLETELLHVFINIINNAIDAFETVSNKKLLFIKTKKQDDIVTITIKDNAGGISKEIISRVFDPYFTTKESSKGTGIGLYICKEIVVKHLYGNIDVENVSFDYEGNHYLGCEFTIELLV